MEFQQTLADDVFELQMNSLDFEGRGVKIKVDVKSYISVSYCG